MAEYEKLLWKQGTPEHEEVKISMTTTCASIIEFQAKATCFLERNPVESAIRNAFELEKWGKLLSAIKEAELDVRGCAERRGWGEVQAIFPKIDELRKDVKNDFIEVLAQQFENREEEQKAIKRQEKKAQLLWLLLKNGCLYKDSKDRNRERVVGTCDWFTDNPQFKEWLLPSESQGPSLLYVTADPGCGKSVLSRYLIEEILPDDDRTVCYFFFKDDFAEQKSSLRALCSLLHQLLVSNNILSTNGILENSILEKYEVQGERFVESFSEIWSTFIDVTSRQDTVCVIDALDECDETDRDRLITAITGICNQSTRNHQLKFLLTSRPYEHIRRVVDGGFDRPVSWIHLQGDSGPTADRIAEEIRIVMMSRIDEVAKGYSLKPDERDLIEKQMKAVENRTYLWIHLVFDGLMKSKTLVKLKKKDIMHLTTTLPQGADDAYERILRKSPSQNEARQILHVILGAKRPMSLAEMSVILAFRANDQACGTFPEDDIVSTDELEIHLRNICGLFVTVVDRRVYLLHQTAREFLSQNTTHNPAEQLATASAPRQINVDQYAWRHSMNPTDSNSCLAEICISYLQSDIKEESGSLFEYCALYWVAHHNQSAKACQMAMAKTTEDICLPSESNLRWIQIYNRDHSIPEIRYQLCLLSALGLENAVKMCLSEHNLTATLLENEIHGRDGKGRSPLAWAAIKGHEAVVRLLVDSGKADVDAMCDSHQTPLLYAVDYGNEAVVRLLISTGKADADLKDINGRTPLSYAAENGDESIVRLLINTRKINVDSKDAYGQTPLSFAARRGNEVVARLLIKTGKVDVDSKSKGGQTPLTHAAREGHEAVVRLLIETGKVEVDSKNIWGWTPLSYAAELGNEAVVRLLVDTGEVDINWKSTAGDTLGSLAEERGCDGIVELLDSLGSLGSLGSL
jgi:ankyrin repeat protein